MQNEALFRTTIPITIRKAGIITNHHSDAAASFAEKLMIWLDQHGVASEENRVEDDMDILITLGGDGTLLRIAEKAARLSIPVVGVNLGNLGFLTELVESEAMSFFEKILQGSITVENRLMLRTHLIDKKGQKRNGYRYALNDVVINKNTLDRILNLTSRADRDIITSHKADGLIFSSPTGSTAYSLSAGGPLVHPGIPSILVTPICPFMLSSRPVLLPADKVITTSFHPGDDDTEAKIIIDGQEAWTMCQGDTLYIERAEHPLQLISASSRNYFQVLRNKLHWGSPEE